MRIYPKAIIWLLKSDKFVPIPICSKLYIIIDISERKKVTSLISMGTMWFRERDFRRVSVLLLWRDFVFFVILSAI